MQNQASLKELELSQDPQRHSYPSASPSNLSKKSENEADKLQSTKNLTKLVFFTK